MHKRLLEVFKKYDVRYFFYNGGNDSMDTCNKISKYIKKSGEDYRFEVKPNVEKSLRDRSKDIR